MSNFLKRVYIYALYDRRDGGMRYVGQSKNVWRRVKEHLREPPNRYVRDWIYEMRRAEGGDALSPRRPEAFGYKVLEQPTVEPEKDETPQQAKERLEREWIRKLERNGHPLLNDLPGNRMATGPILFGGSLLPRAFRKVLLEKSRDEGIPIRRLIRNAVATHLIVDVELYSEVKLPLRQRDRSQTPFG